MSIALYLPRKARELAQPLEVVGRGLSWPYRRFQLFIGQRKFPRDPKRARAYQFTEEPIFYEPAHVWWAAHGPGAPRFTDHSKRAADLRFQRMHLPEGIAWAKRNWFTGIYANLVADPLNLLFPAETAAKGLQSLRYLSSLTPLARRLSALNDAIEVERFLAKHARLPKAIAADPAARTALYRVLAEGNRPEELRDILAAVGTRLTTPEKALARGRAETIRAAKTLAARRARIARRAEARAVQAERVEARVARETHQLAPEAFPEVKPKPMPEAAGQLPLRLEAAPGAAPKAGPPAPLPPLLEHLPTQEYLAGLTQRGLDRELAGRYWRAREELRKAITAAGMDNDADVAWLVQALGRADDVPEFLSLVRAGKLSPPKPGAQGIFRLLDRYRDEGYRPDLLGIAYGRRKRYVPRIAEAPEVTPRLPMPEAPPEPWWAFHRKLRVSREPQTFEELTNTFAQVLVRDSAEWTRAKFAQGLQAWEDLAKGIRAEIAAQGGPVGESAAALARRQHLQEHAAFTAQSLQGLVRGIREDVLRSSLTRGEAWRRRAQAIGRILLRIQKAPYTILKPGWAIQNFVDSLVTKQVLSGIPWSFIRRYSKATHGALGEPLNFAGEWAPWEALGAGAVRPRPGQLPLLSPEAAAAQPRFQQLRQLWQRWKEVNNWIETTARNQTGRAAYHWKLGQLQDAGVPKATAAPQAFEFARHRALQVHFDYANRPLVSKFLRFLWPFEAYQFQTTFKWWPWQLVSKPARTIRGAAAFQTVAQGKQEAEAPIPGTRLQFSPTDILSLNRILKSTSAPETVTPKTPEGRILTALRSAGLPLGWIPDLLVRRASALRGPRANRPGCRSHLRSMLPPRQSQPPSAALGIHRPKDSDASASWHKTPTRGGNQPRAATMPTPLSPAVPSPTWKPPARPCNAMPPPPPSPDSSGSTPSRAMLEKNQSKARLTPMSRPSGHGTGPPPTDCSTTIRNSRLGSSTGIRYNMTTGLGAAPHGPNDHRTTKTARSI